MIIPVAGIFDPVGALWSWSNFAVYTMTYNGIVFPSVEHCFQAAKFSEVELCGMIRRASSPAEAKAIAWKHDLIKRPDWASVRYTIMKSAVHEKISQWGRFRSQLLSSYPFPIIETSNEDSVWGIGEDAAGDNLWGQCAMELRSQFLQLDDTPNCPPISLDAKFDTESEWTFLRETQWEVPRCIVADGNYAGTIEILSKDIVELVEIYLRRHVAHIQIPKWSKETQYSYGSATLQLGKHIKSHVNKKVFDAARAFAYQIKYSGYSPEADARSCIPGWHEKFLEIISKEIQWDIGLPLLVIGAGVGDEANRLWRHFGREAILSDISEVLALNCQRQAPNARTRIGVAENLSDIKSESIGSYFALRTLESMFLDQLAALREVHRVLKPGGILGVSISCAYNVRGSLLKGRFVGSDERDLAGGAEDVLSILEKMETVGLRAQAIYDLESEWLIIGERPR